MGSTEGFPAWGFKASGFELRGLGGHGYSLAMEGTLSLQAEEHGAETEPKSKLCIRRV